METKQLEEASEAYYAGNPIITDVEFDSAITQLQKNDPDHPFLKRIGAPVPGTLKAKHKIPMGSLDNANNEQEFRAWIPDKTYIHLSHKMDGSSLEFVYQDGSFVQAITRGDGKVGEDVTKNVLRSGNIPLSIHPSIVSVRCECLIHKDDWMKHFSGDANPRNSAAGTLRRHDGHNAKYLRFYTFDAMFNIGDDALSHLEYEDEVMSMLTEWFLTPDCTFSNDLNSMIAWCQETENNRETFPYEIDGVVAKIDDRTRSQKMGDRDGRPKGQIAIKFNPRGSETILRKVVWQVGHTGALTPVGEVDPVGVGGTLIQRVTLCNLDEIERLGIAIGDTVEVIRAGDVIPKLSKCIRKDKRRQTICRPFQCPECYGDIEKNGAKLFCINDECPGKSFARVMTWIKKRNILNIGEGIVKAAGVEHILRLYDKGLDEWANVKVGNGVLGQKRAQKIIDALENSRSVSLSEFLGSIGIKSVGRSLCSVLCEGLGLETINDVFTVHPKQIESLEGFGYTRACDFCSWLLDHDEEVLDIAHLMNFENQPDTKGEGRVFNGETICFTGKSPKPRPEMNSLAKAAGASVVSSVGSSTTILVIADINSISSKAIKARELGIKLMSPEDFLSNVSGN
jgi:DNA ligase (NAD+)